MSRAEPTTQHEPNLDVLAERERIARDLHDTVIGRIFGTGMVLRGLASWAEDPDLRRRLEASVEELDAVIDEIRSTIYSLGSQPGWRERAADDAGPDGNGGNGSQPLLDKR